MPRPFEAAATMPRLHSLAKSRPQRGCLPVTSSPPDSALTRYSFHNEIFYLIIAIDLELVLGRS